jgi:hypothetical protein
MYKINNLKNQKGISVNKYYVYKHTFSNGTVYFGKGSGDRIYSNKRNRYWTSLFNKYGEPKREYLNTGISEDLAFTIEEAFIFASRQIGMKLCNISDGGGASASGYKHSEAAKALISAKLTGVKKSAKVRENMSKAKRKHCRTPSTAPKFDSSKPAGPSHKRALADPAELCNRKAIIQTTVDGIYVNDFSSITEASKATKVNVGNISSVCQGKLKSAGGYHWNYKTKRN